MYELLIFIAKKEKLSPLFSSLVTKYSAANFCFNKGLCMIWNEGILSEHYIKSYALAIAFSLQTDMNQIFQMWHMLL